MERAKGVLSHFGGVIRILILIISIAVITFFVARFFQRRAKVNESERTAKTAQSETRTDSSNRSSNDSEKKDTEDKNEAVIPSGIDDRDDSSAEGEPMPAVGMGLNILLSTAVLTVITYGAVRVKESARTV